jgi:hypothetical protein
LLAAGAAMIELMLTPFQGKRPGRASGYSVFKVLKNMFAASLFNN